MKELVSKNEVNIHTGNTLLKTAQECLAKAETLINTVELNMKKTAQMECEKVKNEINNTIQHNRQEQKQINDGHGQRLDSLEKFIYSRQPNVQNQAGLQAAAIFAAQLAQQNNQNKIHYASSPFNQNNFSQFAYAQSDTSNPPNVFN